MERAREMLRNGDWLTRERVRLVAVALLFASTAGLLYLIATSHAVDLQGRPLGTDFSDIYAAGTYADEGRAALAFDPVQQFARKRAIFGDSTQFYTVLRLALSALLPARRRAAAAAALRARARSLAGSDSGTLFMGDPGHRCDAVSCV